MKCSNFLILFLVGFCFGGGFRRPPDPYRPWVETDNVYYSDQVEYAFDKCIEQTNLTYESKFDWLYNYSFPIMEDSNKTTGLSCVLYELELIENKLINVNQVAWLLRNHYVRYARDDWINFFQFAISLADYCRFNVFEGTYIRNMTEHEKTAVDNVRCIEGAAKSENFENPFKQTNKYQTGWS